MAFSRQRLTVLALPLPLPLCTQSAVCATPYLPLISLSAARTYHDLAHYGAHYDVTATPGTTHLSVIGPDGMAVGVTSTVNLYWGNKVLTDHGIIMNNEVRDVSVPSPPRAYPPFTCPHPTPCSPGHLLTYPPAIMASTMAVWYPTGLPLSPARARWMTSARPTSPTPLASSPARPTSSGPENAPFPAPALLLCCR